MSGMGYLNLNFQSKSRRKKEMLFKKVPMKDLKRYIKIPEPLKGMQCQLGISGPQFFEAKGNKGDRKKKGGKKS